MTDNQFLYQAVIAGHENRGFRRALGQAITLAESRNPNHQKQFQKFLKQLLPHTGKALRLGLSGVPGVGKSSFIEALGTQLTNQGHKVAVLAVDPSSQQTGGSIMGDKTRMPNLAVNDKAFIRPSPAGATLGGVARRTREAMLVCEAAGFDVIIIETVGVGQSETEVANLCDIFTLLMLPAGGDELQGIKRGIMEHADLVVVNKADGDLRAQAQRTCADYAAALRFVVNTAGKPAPEAMLCSAITGDGLGMFWEKVYKRFTSLQQSGQLLASRASQQKAWFWQEVRTHLENLAQHKGAEDLLEEVVGQKMTPPMAAEIFIARLLSRQGDIAS